MKLHKLVHQNFPQLDIKMISAKLAVKNNFTYTINYTCLMKQKKL